MKRNPKRIIKSIILSCSFLVSCGENENNVEDNVLKIVTCEENLVNCAYFLKEYAKNNQDIQVKLEIYECDTLKYKAQHNKIQADILLLDSLSTVNGLNDKLVDFTYDEKLINYSKYVNNFLKNDDGHVYCLPSPGSWYCYCVNLDLVEKYNLNIPNTIDELIEFSNEIKDYAIPFVSSFENRYYYLDAFMQTCIPSFFATAKGGYAFDNLINGNEKMADSQYKSDFSDALSNLYKLTVASFFNQSSFDNYGVDKFFSSEAAVLSVSPSFDFNSYYSSYDCSFNYAFLPLIGRKTSNDWVCSISDSYLAIPKENYTGSKRKLIDNFANFFSSSDGQNLLLKNEEGTIKQNHFSFANQNIIPETTKTNEKIINAISQGRVFLIDKFYPSFSSASNSFKEYAEDKINTDDIIADIDLYNEQARSNSQRYYEISSLANIDGESKENMLETIRVISSSIKSQMKLDVLIVDESFLLQPIYNGLIYEREMSMIFNETSYCYSVKSTGKVLKEMLDFCDETNARSLTVTKERDASMQRYFSSLGNVSITFIEYGWLDGTAFYSSGASTTLEGGNKKYLLANKNEIKDDREYYVAVPASFVRGGEFDLTTTGDSFSCLDAYKQYLEDHK